MAKKVINEVCITLKVIGAKYKPLILHYLIENGSCRFNELIRYLTGAPKKTIISELKELEQDGIIARIVLSEEPLQVKYEMTSHGLTLKNVLEAMCEWGYNNKTSDYEIIHPICHN